jgi:hypothetical protein
MKLFMHHYRKEIEGWIMFSVPVGEGRRFLRGRGSDGKTAQKLESPDEVSNI